MVRWAHRFSLRTRLLFIAVFLTVVFTVIVFKSAMADYREGMDALHHQARAAARVLAAEQHGLELATRQFLFGLALATPADRFAFLVGPDCTRNLRLLLKANPVFNNVGVAGPDGLIVCSTEAQATGLDLSEREYFVRAAASRSFVISAPIVGKVAKRVTIVVAQPLVAPDDTLAGVLYAALDLGYLEQSMGRQGLPDGAHVLLVDDLGVARLRVPDAEGFTGRTIVDRDVFAMLAARRSAGSGELRATSDEPRMVGYAPLATDARGHLFVWVSLPMDRVRDEVLANILKDAAFYIAALLALLGLLWWGLERIVVGPVTRLTQAALRMGHGDLSTRTGIADQGTEIGLLADSLDRLALHVQRTTRALRTLSAGNQTLLHATGEAALLQRMCDVAVDEGRYLAAAVFLVDGTDAAVPAARLVARAGQPVRSDDRVIALDPDAGDGGGNGNDWRDTVRTAVHSGIPSVLHFAGAIATDTPESGVLFAAGRGSVFSVPIRFEKEVIGALTFATVDDGAFDAEEAALLTEMAADLSFGLTNLRVRASLTASAYRATRARLTLSAGNRTLAEGLDESAMLQRICRIAVEHGGYVIAYVTYVDPLCGAGARVVACHGTRESGLDQHTASLDDPLARPIVGPTLVDGTIVLMPDLHALPLPPSWLAAGFAGLVRAALTLPLHDEGRLIGALTVLSASEPSFEPAERELLGELAQDISFGIASSRGRLRSEQAAFAIQRATTHDAVTGLPALPAMITELDEIIVAARADATSVAVLAVCFPRLDPLYRSMGYPIGSRIAGVIAQRLSAAAAQGTRVGRLRSDEFALLVPGIDAGGAAALVTKLQQAFDETIEIEGAPLDVQPTTGSSYYPGHGDDGDLLLRHASLAAREAARRGLPHLLYSSDLEVDNPASLRLAGELRGAIDRRELVLHFQPKVSLATGEICGAEALVRWQHAVHGLVPPDEFIPIAEETGQIRELTYLVLDLAVLQIGAWARRGIELPIAVNLSARDLQNPLLTERVEGLLATWGVPARLLHFEVTETALLEDPEAARQRLAHLRDLGSQIFIDDFGTGYSSLNYLVALPVHALKIDRSFIVQMAERTQAATVVSSVISMAHGLGLKVVAEGVETVDERARLTAMRCDEIQGYLVARPLPPDDFVAFLRAHRHAQDDDAVRPAHEPTS